MNYKGKLYGKNGSEIVPLIMNSEDVDLLEIKVMMCREIIEHLAAWFEGATLDPIKLKGMVGTVQSEFRHNRVLVQPLTDIVLDSSVKIFQEFCISI